MISELAFAVMHKYMFADEDDGVKELWHDLNGVLHLSCNCNDDEACAGKLHKNRHTRAGCTLL